MSAKPIRVKLPGGDFYAPALLQAASKTGDRSGLTKKQIKALNDLVEASVAALNSGGSTVITLEMNLHDDSIVVRVIGKGCTSPTKKLIKQLDTLGEKRAQTFERKKSASALTISFEI